MIVNLNHTHWVDNSPSSPYACTIPSHS